MIKKGFSMKVRKLLLKLPWLFGFSWSLIWIVIWTIQNPDYVTIPAALLGAFFYFSLWQLLKEEDSP